MYISIIRLFIFILLLSVPAWGEQASEVVPPILTPETGNEEKISAPIDDIDKGSIRVQILPLTETTLSSEIAARIEKIQVDIGDRFNSGKTLIIFDCEMYKVQREKAQAELEEAVKILEVNRRLEKLNSVSELEMAVSLSRMQRAKAELSLRESQVKKCAIYAPFTGRIVKRNANPFQYVSPGEPLLEIIDDLNLTAQLLIPSKWLKWVKKSLSFTVHIDETGKNYTAIVTAIGARVDPVSQTLEIRASIKGNHPELLAGMSGTANFKVPE